MPIDVQYYDTPGSYTWNKPASAKLVKIVMSGGGGGGGGGLLRIFNTSAAGGAGGASGGFGIIIVPASLLPASATVVVGAGGAGGSGASTPSTDGNDGVVGGNSSFDGHRASGGGFGTRARLGIATSPGGLAGRAVPYLGRNGADGNNGGPSAAGAGLSKGNQSADSDVKFWNSPGGAGGGFTIVGLSQAGSSGGGLTEYTGYTPAAGGVDPGGDGASATTQAGVGAGGGGGGSRVNGAGSAGAGGHGSYPGGGGGGGGSAENSFTTKAAGDGADGFVLVISYG